jgi:aspartyl-tRNA(Asn)/glutamyl-tRNA(Gln) amidotransferase subunit B
MAERFEREDGLSAYDASMMAQSLPFARYYEAVKSAGAPAKLAANWLMGEVSKRLNATGVPIEAAPVSPALLAAIIRRIADGTVSNNGAREVLDVLWAGGRLRGESLEAGYADWAIEDGLAEVDGVIEGRGLKLMNDAGALEALVDQVLAANAKSVDEYRAGKDKAFNALVGQVMKASKGQANPAQASELLKKKLGA